MWIQLRDASPQCGQTSTRDVDTAEVLPPSVARPTRQISLFSRSSIQEAVNNAVKYAHAQVIKVSIKPAGEDLSIEVTDDGFGFDLKAVGQGNGLNNMKKRAREIGGSITIDSQSGGGTCIKLLVPEENSNQPNNEPHEKPM